MPGWSGDHDWVGEIPFEELPRAVDPPSGRFINANNRIVTDDYPYLYEDHGRPIEDFLLEVKASIGSSTWNDALEMMRMVKEHTKLSRVADEYIAFFRSL